MSLIPKIENRQTRYHPNLPRCLELLVWLAKRAERHRNPSEPPWGEVTLLLVGNRTSAGTHRTVFDRHGPTDVITMRYAPMPGLGTETSGELIVNIERAVEEGRKRAPRGWTPAHELALYIAHGLDHLTGADDADDTSRRRMRARELRWVRAADRAGLLHRLLRVRAARTAADGKAGARAR